jgi:hypothetical protein
VPLKSATGALFALLLALFWALAPSSPPAGEAATIAASARALIATGTLDVAAAGDGKTLPATVVHGGQRRATTALGAIVALVPAEALARLAGRVLPTSAATAAPAPTAAAATPAIAPAPRLASARRPGATLDWPSRVGALAASGTAALFAALVGVVFFGLLVRDGLSRRAALAFTAILALATPLCWSARVPDGTALATLLLLVASDAARRFVAAEVRATAWTLGAALGALVLVDPTLLLAALVIVAWCGVHRHAPLDGAAAAGIIAPLVVAVALVLGHRAWVGAPATATGDLVQGLDGLLLSTGKSLFIYGPPLLLAPPALVWLWRTRRAEAQLVLVVAAAVLLAAAHLADWHGDPTWGPRRALPLTPLLLEVVARAWAARPRRRWLALTVAAGLWVQTVGLAIAPSVYYGVVDEVRVASGAPSWFALEPDECHFMPQFSPVVGHGWLLSHLVRRDRHFEIQPPYQLLVSTPTKLDDVGQRLYLDWFVRDWPLPPALAWLGLLATIAGAAAWTIRRRLV